jgi:hypothetical protein
MRYKKNESGLSGKERCWDRAGPTPTHGCILRPLSVFGKCKSGQRETPAPVCHKDKGRGSGVNIAKLETRIANVNPTGVSFSETTAMKPSDSDVPLQRSARVANCDRFASLKHATSNLYSFTEQGVCIRWTEWGQVDLMTRSVPGVRKGSEERTDLAPSPLDTPAPFAPRLKLWSFLPPLQHSKAAAPHKLPGLRHRPSFSQNDLTPALNAGLIEMTRPESPRARDQKYRLSDPIRGKEVGYGG